MEQFKMLVAQIETKTESVPVVPEDGIVRNEKGQREVSNEDLADPHVQEWLARNKEEGLVKNKIEVTNEMREFKRMLDEFEATYSIEELFAVVDLTADPDRKHPLRDLAKKALNPINEFRSKNISTGDDELNTQWKKISNAVGIINKGMVDHNR